MVNRNHIVKSSDFRIRTQLVHIWWCDRKESAYKSNEEGFIATLPLNSDENDVYNASWWSNCHSKSQFHPKLCNFWGVGTIWWKGGEFML